MSLPIKDIQEFGCTSPQTKAWLYAWAVFWLMAALAPTISLALAVASMFACSVCLLKAAHEMVKNRIKIETIYRTYLDGLPYELVVTAYNSPEVDDCTINSIQNFLNDKHPGWSFK